LPGGYLPEGAPAPPVGLLVPSEVPAPAVPEPLLPVEPEEPEVPLAPVPPASEAVPPPAWLSPPAGLEFDDSPPDSFSPASVEEPVLALVDPEDVVEVVDVEVFCAASACAELSLGGVMLGVLRGAESETLLPPPQALTDTERITATAALTAAREARGA
jgi:hypothetical protein